MAAYSCSEDQLQQVQELVGDYNTAETVCSEYDCSVGASTCVLQYLSAQNAQLSADVKYTAQADVALGLDVAFVCFSTYLVFIMLIGFSLLVAANVRAKSAVNVVLKNAADLCVAAIGYYLLGFAFSYGQRSGGTANDFIGDWNFALSETTQVSHDDYGDYGEDAGGVRPYDAGPDPYEDFVEMGWHQWMFNFALCAVATTIAAGATAERITLGAYLAYAFMFSSVVYPVIVHWVWSTDGWLSPYNTKQDGYALILKTGAVDFAGAGVVHMAGGCAGLVGAWLLGPRIGRYDASGKVNAQQQPSATLALAGTLLLWLGFYGFSPGANLAVSSKAAATIVSRVAVTTTLSAAAGGLAVMAFRFARSSSWDVLLGCRGALAGLVSITAGCAVVEPWAALIAGGVGGLLLVACERGVLVLLKVDDPLGAVALHYGCGAWALLFTGLLAAPRYMQEVYGGEGLGEDLKQGHRYGIFYGGHGQVLLCLFIEALVVTAWVAALVGPLFLAFKALKQLRVPVDVELAAIDNDPAHAMPSALAAMHAHAHSHSALVKPADGAGDERERERDREQPAAPVGGGRVSSLAAGGRVSPVH